MELVGVLLFGQRDEIGGRGLGGFRLRTVANRIGVDVLVVDSADHMTAEEILALLIAVSQQSRIGFVGISTNWVDRAGTAYITREFLAKVRAAIPNVLLLAGGARSRRDDRLYDYIFTGFADSAFVEFVGCYVRGGVSEVHSSFRQIYVDGRQYPVDPQSIDTHLRLSDGFASHQPIPIEISRGCVFSCSFCRFPHQGKLDYTYQRTPVHIATEFKRNSELFGTYRYSIMDDTFNDSVEKLSRVQQAIEIAKLTDFQCVSYIRPELLVTKPEMIRILTSQLGLTGAVVGIESMAPQTRKAINRGMDINRVLDVCYQLAQAGVKIHAGFIVGLSGDTESSVRSTNDFLHDGDHPFASWGWYGLGIKPPTLPTDLVSKIDINPVAHGYDFKDGTWSTPEFTTDSANKLADELNETTRHSRKYGGWNVAGAWHLGMTTEEIDEDTYVRSEFISRLHVQSRARAVKLLESYGIA